MYKRDLYKKGRYGGAFCVQTGFVHLKRSECVILCTNQTDMAQEGLFIRDLYKGMSLGGRLRVQTGFVQQGWRYGEVLCTNAICARKGGAREAY